jgi:hypothetical protein
MNLSVRLLDPDLDRHEVELARLRVSAVRRLAPETWDRGGF